MTRTHALRSLLPAAVLLAAALPAAAQKGDTTEDWTRQEMAVALLQALETTAFTPPDCVPGQEMFDDVPASDLFCPWIEELARRGITGGCGSGNYCPSAPVSRAQMAAFLVKTQFPAEIPAGVTVTGRWGFDAHVNGAGEDWGASISFPGSMPTILSVQYREDGSGPTEECPGFSSALPSAAPGNLCIYESETLNAVVEASYGASPFGATIYFNALVGGDMFAHGTWAATAPVE